MIACVLLSVLIVVVVLIGVFVIRLLRRIEAHILRLTAYYVEAGLGRVPIVNGQMRASVPTKIDDTGIHADEDDETQAIDDWFKMGADMSG